jgi:hypothetical protein
LSSARALISCVARDIRTARPAQQALHLLREALAQGE